MTNMLSDSDARSKIREVLNKNFLVEAGAGSGKTTSMVARMVELIRQGEANIPGIVAITFTRKAAAELSQRFQTSLEKAYKDESNLVKKARLKQALFDLENSYVGTIHSFCARLLRERPIEAGVDPSFIEIQGVDERILKEKAWDEFIYYIQVNQPEMLAELGDLDISPVDVKIVYDQLTDYPDVCFEFQQVIKPDFTRIRVAFLDFINRVKPALPVRPHIDGYDNLQNALRRLLRCSQVYDLTDDKQIYKILCIFEPEAKIVQRRWESAQLAKDTKAEFDQLKRELVLPALVAWREYCYPILMRFADRAVKYYDTLRLKSGKLNFQDLLMKSAALLRENEEVRCYFQEKFTHLLVDEFQDTDPIQAEVILYLTAQNTAERDWRKLVPAPGSLFVVGDPKQSIYRFRRADITTYLLVRNIIENSGGEVLTLTSNFRSINAIGNWINSALTTLLPERSNEYQAALALVETKTDGHSGSWGGVFTIQIDKQSNNKQELVAEADAQAIASWIRGAIDSKLCIDGRPIVPDDVLIILKYKKEMGIYARALEDYDIPYEITGGGAIQNSCELQDLVVLLKSLADPDNPVLLVATLRGTLFGLSDQELYELRKANGCFNFLYQIPEVLSEASVLQNAWKALRQYHEWCQTLPPSLAIEKIIQHIGILPYALAGNTPKSGAGYILFVLEYLRALEQAEVTSFTKAVGYLSNIMENGVEEEINIEGATSGGVRLMNLHKAKGLEAPIVFLANPGKNIYHDPDHHISRKDDKPFGYFRVARKKGYNKEKIIAHPPNWDTYMNLERRFRDAEEDRLVYVALTRPKNALIISRYPSKTASSPWQKIDEYLKECSTITTPQVRYQKPMLPILNIDLSDVQNLEPQVNQKIKDVSAHSYAVAAVTTMAKGDKETRSLWHATNKGMGWGRVVHRILQRYTEDCRLDLGLLASNILVEEERSVDEVDEVLKVINCVIASSYWKRAMVSPERYVEIPFGLKVDRSDLGESDLIVSGTIDLVFWENDGWVIIDYKTDSYENDKEKEALEAYYKPQIELYKEYWTRLTNRKVKETKLLFTNSLESLDK